MKSPRAFYGWAAIILLGCRFEPLLVVPVDWNPNGEDLGAVTAVAELDGRIIVFSDRGVTVLSGGEVEARDSSVVDWRTASVIPTPDGGGTCIAGIDGEGRVLKLDGLSSLQDISVFYGLTGSPVRGLAALGGPGVVFSLEGDLAVADGSTVSRFDFDAREVLAAGGGRVATSAEGEIRVLVPGEGLLYTYSLPEARLLAFSDGRLIAATPQALYVENPNGVLRRRYEAQQGELHGLAVSGSRVWFADGESLGVLRDNEASIAEGVTVPRDSSLLGSPSGDVWVLSAGALFRYAAEPNMDEARQAWKEEIRPIYQRVCRECHAPGGSSGVPLSRFEDWFELRKEISTQVIEIEAMPPAGIPFSEEEREVIRQWLVLVGQN